MAQPDREWTLDEIWDEDDIPTRVRKVEVIELPEEEIPTWVKKLTAEELKKLMGG